MELDGQEQSAMIHVEQHGPVIAIRMARGLLGRPWAWTTAYWVDGLLIDSGPHCTAAQLVKVLAQLPLERVVVTHSHEDNIGGLAAIHARFPRVPVYASSHALAVIKEPARLRPQLYRRLMWGIPQAHPGVQPIEELGATIKTRDYSLRIVETPGHTRDHISLFEPTQRWLFSGDAFIGGAERMWAREIDLFGVLGTLHTLADLRPERLFPSSGEVRRNPRPEIAEKIGGLVRLCREVARLDAIGMSNDEMVATLFEGAPTGRPTLRVWTGGHVSAANLITACRSYNALVAADHAPNRSIPPEPPRPPQTSSPTDSSANASADRGDVVR